MSFTNSSTVLEQVTDSNMEVNPHSRSSALTEELDKALESLSSHRLWLLCMFLLCCSPGVFNAWHIVVSTFYAFTPPHWCQVPELDAANWTSDQIKRISMSNPTAQSTCTMIGWNYTHLAMLGYEKAVIYINSTSPPDEIPCVTFFFEDKEPYRSVVSQWNLVCDYKIGKTNVQGSIAIGKLFGGFIFGFIADRFGRKISFILSCATYMIFGPLAAFAPTFWVFIATRFMIGVAGSGCYQTGFTILAELVSTRCRTILGCIYNCSYPVGYMTLAVGALVFSSWKSLQLGISLPMFILLIHCWFLPESPRWLLTQGLIDRAWKIVEKVDKSVVPEDINQYNIERSQVSTANRFVGFTQKISILVSSGELIKRILLCYFAWFVAALIYYVLALNSFNFGTDQHVYTFLSGLVEIPGYSLPILVLLFLGRKSTTSILYFISGATLLAITGIPKEQTNLILLLAMLGRFADVAVFGVVVVYTSELFPTTIRNTALGSSLAISQFGSISAPYIVDMLSDFGWYVPTTLCGCAALICSALVLLLPETRGRSLQQTVEELKQSADRVSIRNCCRCS